MAQQDIGRHETGAQTRAGSNRQDALALLARDHRDLDALFQRYTSAADATEKSALCARICLLLKAHARIEEEIFYPAARRRIDDKDLINEALIEHQAAKDLIEEIESASIIGSSASALSISSIRSLAAWCSIRASLIRSLSSMRRRAAG
jgi:hemerythrin superfamily protein